MKCEFCGYEFTKEQAGQACRGCPISQCNLIKGPRCGYETLPEPKFVKSIKKALGKKEGVKHGKKPLPLLNEGEKATVVELLKEDKKSLHRLMAMGVMPGMPIEILQRKPTYVLELGNTQIAIDKEMAEKIIVEVK